MQILAQTVQFQVKEINYLIVSVMNIIMITKLLPAYVARLFYLKKNSII